MMSTTQKWEYLISEFLNEKPNEHLERGLNMKGKAGWELVQFFPEVRVLEGEGASYRWAVFKRPSLE